DVSQVLIWHVGTIVEVEAVGVHGWPALGLCLLHAVSHHGIPHETNVGFAAGLLRGRAVAARIVLDHRQRLHGIGNPAIRYSGGTPQPRRGPRRHPYGWAGPMERSRGDEGVGVVKMLASVGEALAGPAAANDLQRLFGTGGTLRHRHLESLKVVRLIAHTDTEDQPTLGGKVNHRTILGYVHRMMQRQQQDAGAD